MKRIELLKVCLLWLGLVVNPLYAADAEPVITVYAAVSLTNVLDELGTQYSKETGIGIRLSYGASSTLARQIEAGAKADVFFSADNDWMDYLQERNLINKASRKSLLGNQLVLIAPTTSKVQVKIAPGVALSNILGRERLAIADPVSVPAGKYAKAALIKLGVWESIADKLVRADNVRTALTFVDRMEVPLGIVYETDAMMDNKVRIVDRFPTDSHAPIVYPIALAASATPRTTSSAEKFIAYLSSEPAQVVFKKAGFTILK
jgi:molybdate transport system substrate-binding protein